MVEELQEGGATTETIMVCRLKQIVGAMSEGVIFCPSISLEEYQDMQVLPDEKRQEQCFNTAIYWLGSGEAERAYQDIVFQRIVLAGGLN